MNVAVLGPGGVGGLLAAALADAGEQVTVVARESTVEVLRERGLHVQSVKFGELEAHVPATDTLPDPVELLIVATKAAGLAAALERVPGEPELILPLLNGLDHLALLRARYGVERVLAGTIRVEADRPEPGVIVHTSPFLLVDMATSSEAVVPAMERAAAVLVAAGVPARVVLPASQASEARVMWSKLVRLNALACTTSAYDRPLGEIRSTPELRADLVGAIEEACAVGAAEGAEGVDPARAIAELEQAHATLGSSMQRDIAAGREPELDAIPGAVLRAGARHGIDCPTIERLVRLISERMAALRP